MPTKSRVDLLLVERGLAESRAQAQALVLAGRVYLGEQRIDKAGSQLDASAELTVRPGQRFVSRGGLKLDAALDALDCAVDGAVCVDIGASTGGFTDCLLVRGARKVHAVDVGHGQLASRLRNDPRVVVRERTNARHLTAADFEEPIDLVVVDASFIGIGKLAPAIASFLGSGGRLVALIKPQFEVGKEVARRARGVITDAEERRDAIDAALADLEAAGFDVQGGCDSSVPGPKGNVEYFAIATKR